MSQIEYFATFDESIEILRALTAEGLRIIVEPELTDTPHAMVFTSVDDTVTHILARAPEFFLAGPFTRQDVAFTQLSGGTAHGKFAINWLAGPIMQCLAARLGEVDGVPWLLPGDFSYQDTYRNLETNAWEKPTSELKAAFRKITSLVKTRCPPFEYKPGSKVFIAPKAREMLEAKAATISAD